MDFLQWRIDGLFSLHAEAMLELSLLLWWGFKKTLGTRSLLSLKHDHTIDLIHVYLLHRIAMSSHKEELLRCCEEARQRRLLCSTSRAGLSMD